MTPAARVSHGQRWRAYPDAPPEAQVFVEVTRVARTGAWADIRCFTWAVRWSKRQPLKRGRLPFQAELFDWDRSDLAAQEMAWRASRGEQP